MTNFPIKSAPNPDNMNYMEWARQITAYINNRDREAATLPAAILLAHYNAKRPIKPATDGLLMYDPVTKLPVISIDGAWHHLQVV